MVYVFLADGFEEIEALATVDIIRRAGIECTTVGVTGSTVTGAHSISVKTDINIENLNMDKASAVVLPGGMPGTTNLEKDERVINAVKYAANKGILLAAICAAPSILGHLGMLTGKKASCYDGFEDALIGAEFIPDSVCVDGNIITACGAGMANDFALEIVAYLSKDRSISQKIKKAIKYR